MSLYFGMLSEYPYPLKIILREHSFYIWLDTDIVNISVQISYSTPQNDVFVLCNTLQCIT